MGRNLPSATFLFTEAPCRKKKLGVADTSAWTRKQGLGVKFSRCPSLGCCGLATPFLSVPNSLTCAVVGSNQSRHVWVSTLEDTRHWVSIAEGDPNLSWCDQPRWNQLALSGKTHGTPNNHRGLGLLLWALHQNGITLGTKKSST